jgi:hypothetical protein
MPTSQPRPAPSPAHAAVHGWAPARLLDGAPDLYDLWPANDPEPASRPALSVSITGLIELG